MDAMILKEMKQIKLLFWLIGILLVLPIVNAGSDITMNENYSVNPVDYIFWDNGDEIKNGTYRAAPANNAPLTTQKWTTTAISLNYSSEIEKFGNMSIHLEDVSRNVRFDFGSIQTNVTFQLALLDNPADTGSNIYMVLYANNNVTGVGWLGLLNVVCGNVNHFYRTNNATNYCASPAISRPTGGMNFTTYIAPAGAYIALYINRTLVVNDTTTEGFRFFEINADGYNVSVDDIMIWNGAPEDRPIVPPPSDTEPASILLINLTILSGNLGQIIYNNSPEQLGKLSGKARTNDTTPTIRATTNKSSTCAIIDLNRDLNWTDIFKGNANDDNGAPALTHILTLNSSNSSGMIGLHNFSIGCKDSSGNENRTSTSGKFTINITDSMSPNSTLWKPENNIFYTEINNTNINFTFSAVDNLDKNFSAYVYIDNVLEFTNLTYLNGTNVSYFKTVSSGGTHTWYVNTTDSFNNQNQSFINTFTIEQAEAVTLFLNGQNNSRKYEYLSLVNISANCTPRLAGNCQVELDLYADGYKYNNTAGNNWINLTFNTSPLRIRNWTHGARTHTIISSGTLNITSDNKTTIELVSFNVSSAGTTTNLNISYYGKEKKYTGDLKSIYLTDNKFMSTGIYYNAINFTYLSGGSNFIYYNFSDINFPINMTFQLSGFDLDLNNQFNKEERFNISTLTINSTKSIDTESPLGIFDDFVNNNTRWSVTSVGVCSPILSYLTSPSRLRITCSSGEGYLSYSDLAGDLRNSSTVINQLIHPPSTDYSFSIRATDGTSEVTLYEVSYYYSDDHIRSYNITLKRLTEDDKTWQSSSNHTFAEIISGIRDISRLDFTKQISLRYYSGKGSLDLDKIEWSGAWLNYSANNGTYKPKGNFTSNVLNVTKTNISKATLSWVDYEPAGTNILGYISSECNSTPNFESVQNDITHTFVSNGNKPCVRFQLNSSINTTSPVVRKYTFDITPSAIENVTVDLGDDGNNEYTFTGKLNSTTSPTFVNLTPTSNQLNTIKISSKTSGVIMLDQFKVNSSINPISLNKTYFENCYNCSINFTFSGNNLNVYDLKFDFLGSWNFTAIARYGTLKINKTIQVYYSNFNVSIPSGYGWYDVFPASKNSKNATPYTQNNNRPIWNISNFAYDESIDVYVKTNATMLACLNVTYGNESNRSSATINSFFLNTTYQKILNNISLINISKVTQINESINITINRTVGNSTILNYSGIQPNEESVRNNSEPYYLLYRNIDYRINYTTSNFTLINISFNQSALRITYNHTVTIPNSKGIWNWWDLYNCSQRFYIPYIYFTSICSDCYFENGTQLDRFNKIIE